MTVYGFSMQHYRRKRGGEGIDHDGWGDAGWREVSR